MPLTIYGVDLTHILIPGPGVYLAFTEPGIVVSDMVGHIYN